ncbi:MAG TPA: MFS transporter [Spirochaetota bacterium]|nr:MFS transporter [Spirochaetota bacterium]HPJ35251.1 MFS transporter [Spirochaetota bacterium]
MNIAVKIFQIFSERFLSLKEINFRYFLAGQSISLIGTWMQRTAQQWLVYSLTNSPFLLGLLGVCQFAPIMLLSLFAGVYVDRYPKKRILLITQTVSMLQAFIISVLVFSGYVKYWHVFILAGILGLSNTFDMPTRQSFFIELVGRDNVKNAIGLNSTIVNIARIAGPAAAGVIMAGPGIGFCFFLNALSYIFVIFSLLKIKAYAKNIRVKKQHILAEVSDGLKYIRNNGIVFYAILSMLVIGTFAMNTNVLIPVFAAEVLKQGPRGFSFLLSAMGTGALAGSLYFAARSRGEGRKNGIAIYSVILALALIAAGFATSYSLLLAVLVILGFFNMLLMGTANSTVQLNTSDEYRGRAMSVYILVFAGTTPVGNFITGTIAQSLGPAKGFIFCGLVSLLLMMLLLILFRGYRGSR